MKMKLTAVIVLGLAVGLTPKAMFAGDFCAQLKTAVSAADQNFEPLIDHSKKPFDLGDHYLQDTKTLFDDESSGNIAGPKDLRYYASLGNEHQAQLYARLVRSASACFPEASRKDFRTTQNLATWLVLPENKQVILSMHLCHGAAKCMEEVSVAVHKGNSLPEPYQHDYKVHANGNK